VNLYLYLYKIDQIKNDELRQECSTHDMVEKYMKCLPSPLLVLWSRKSPPMGRTACTELTCLTRVNLYLYLYKIDQIKNDELRQECSTHDMVEKYMKYLTRKTWC